MTYDNKLIGCVNFFIAISTHQTKQGQTITNSEDVYETPSLLTENLAPDTTNQINTSYLEERVVDSKQAYPTSNLSLAPSVEAEMSDGTWFARQQLMKPVQLAQFEWSTTTPRDTPLYSALFPQVLAQQDSLVRRTLNMYAFFKMTPCFRVQINATQFHQGQLICYWDPFNYQSELDDLPGDEPSYLYDVASIISATGLPHVKIMASESDAVELCIPFIHPRSFLTTNVPNIGNTMGRFEVRVMNPLLVAEGATPTLTATVWVYAKNAEVHVPIQNHDFQATTKSRTQQTPRDTQTKQISSLQADTPSTQSFLQKGMSQASDAIGNLLSGNIGQALRKGHGLIDTALSAFGFDYPSDTISPSKTVMPLENMAVTIGKSRSQRLAVDPFSMHILHDEVASESLESMDLLKIAQTPMLIKQVYFNSITAAGTLLYSLPVHPNISPSSIEQVMQRTYLSFATDAFNYWSGGLIYDIEVVATRFHSGKLLFAYVPNDQSIPSYEAASLSLPNVILDIQQTSSFTFKVPYTSSTSMKSSTLYNETTQEQFVDAAIGTLVCYIQNPLVCASNVAPTVELNIYLSADSDFNLYVPKKPSFPSVIFPEPPQQEEQFEKTTIALNETGNYKSKTSAVLSKDQTVSIPRPHFGEDYSMRDLIKRFSYASPTNSDNDNIETRLIYINPLLYPLATSTEPLLAEDDLSWLSYFGLIYSAWSGSIRYKFATNAPRDSDSTLTVYHSPYDFPIVGSNAKTRANGFAMVRSTLSQDNAIEVEVPYYSRFNMLFTRFPLSLPEDVLRLVNNGFLQIHQEGTTKHLVDMYVAAGEDFRYVYMRPPPLCRQSTWNEVVFP